MSEHPYRTQGRRSHRHHHEPRYRGYLQSENDSLDDGLDLPYAVSDRRRCGRICKRLKSAEDLYVRGTSARRAFLPRGGLHKRNAFLIGNEGNGLTDAMAEAAECLIRIPMEGKVESLNAAIAPAVLMYEAHGQRA